MSGFRDVLREVSRGLALRLEARERVLRELAGDLDGFYREGRSSGLDEDSARARAVEFADLSSTAGASMREVHGPLHRRWSSGLRKALVTRLERGALLLCWLLVLKVALDLGLAARSLDAVWPASLWLAPASLLAVRILFGALVGGWRYHVDGDHRPDGYERAAVASRRVMLAAAALGFLGLGHALLAARLQLPPSGVPGSTTRLRDQLLHLHGQLALASTYLGVGVLALILHARILARAAYLRGIEDDLLDEFALESPTHFDSSEPRNIPCT